MKHERQVMPHETAYAAPPIDTSGDHRAVETSDHEAKYIGYAHAVWCASLQDKSGWYPHDCDCR
jgi:hypothetical protein